MSAFAYPLFFNLSADSISEFQMCEQGSFEDLGSAHEAGERLDEKAEEHAYEILGRHGREAAGSSPEVAGTYKRWRYPSGQ